MVISNPQQAATSPAPSCSASHSTPRSIRPMTFTDSLSPSTLRSLRWQKDTLHRPASNQPAQGGVCRASKMRAGVGTDRYTPMGSSHLFQSSLQPPRCPQPPQHLHLSLSSLWAHTQHGDTKPLRTAAFAFTYLGYAALPKFFPVDYFFSLCFRKLEDKSIKIM